MLSAKQNRIRLDTFNLLKGLLMISIVIGHRFPKYSFENASIIGLIGWFFSLMRHGANPALFMIVGFGFRVLSTRKCLNKTVNELIKPYLYVMLAYMICLPLFHYAVFRWWPGAIHETTRYFWTFLLGIPKSGKAFLGYELYECSVVWFMLALFISMNILNWILNCKKERIQYILVFICFILGFALAKADINYYCVPQGLLGVVYCYAGFLIKKYKLYQRKELPGICAVLAVAAVFEYVMGDFNMPQGVFKYGAFEIILAGCSGAFLVLLSIIISNMECHIFNPIKSIGVYTYWIICLHSVEMTCIPWYKWNEYMQNRQALGFIIEIGTAVLICFAGCMLLKRITKYCYRRRQLANG